MYLLVTGGAGFIGTNFIHRALSLRPEWRIINLDALTYAGNPANFKTVDPEAAKRHRFIHGDIRDGSLLEKIFSENRIGGVIHFAAETHVDRSIKSPEVFLDTNVSGTFKLLQATLKAWESQSLHRDFRFLHVSTDEVYGSLGPEGLFTETSPYDPSSPYSASKAASDHFVKAFFRTYALPALVTHCSNNFGPFQFPEKLIPLMILNILEEKPLPVYGDGKNVRDWLYVVDHCDALIRIFEAGEPGETYDIGGAAERENIQIVQLLCDLLDSRLNRSGERSSRGLVRFVTDRPGHDRRYAIDARKVRREIGWRPEWSFEDGLRTTVDWYLDHLDWVRSVRSGEYLKWMEANYGRR
jgi:dTDP-glucose 4,6-dehydratase